MWLFLNNAIICCIQLTLSIRAGINLTLSIYSPNI